MIDIHNHSLYGVDDGPDSIEMSIQMLLEAAKSGIDSIIFTPHYRHHMFGFPQERIRDAYLTLREEAARRKETEHLRLYLGCEYHVDSEIYKRLEMRRAWTLANSEYVLTEYSYTTPYRRMQEYTQELVSRGYRPVLAHIERYEVFLRDMDLVEEISRLGGLIQVNADSCLGRAGRKVRKLCRLLLDDGLIDFIASDAHDLADRANHLGACRDLVARRLGEGEAERIFEENPARILAHGSTGIG